MSTPSGVGTQTGWGTHPGCSRVARAAAKGDPALAARVAAARVVARVAVRAVAARAAVPVGVTVANGGEGCGEGGGFGIGGGGGSALVVTPGGGDAAHARRWGRRWWCRWRRRGGGDGGRGLMEKAVAASGARAVARAVEARACRDGGWPMPRLARSSLGGRHRATRVGVGRAAA